MGWIWLIAVAGCGSSDGDADTGVDDPGNLGIVQAAFVGYTYWTPDRVAGQDEDWCATTYLVDTDDEVTCSQTVKLVSNGNVMWTHYVTHLDGETDVVEVLPFGSWSDAGPYEALLGGHKYMVDGVPWTVWPSQATNWDIPDSGRTVLAGGTVMAFAPAPG